MANLINTAGACLVCSKCVLVTCNLNYSPDSKGEVSRGGKNVTTGNDLLLKSGGEEEGERQTKLVGSWGMGGVLFSNFYFHISAENKGKNKRKVPLELLGELAHLFSVRRAGIKDLSANNLFRYSLCHFPLLRPAILGGFMW